MKKRYHKFIMAGTIVVLTGSLVSIHGQAVSVSKEKPLAGITLSLDHYCETVIADAQEDAAQAQKEAQNVQTGAVDTTQQSATVQDAAAAAATDQTTLTDLTPQATKEPEQKIKLSAKYKNLGIVKVDTYLNVRKKASENSALVGKMTKNTGCDILSTKKGWSKICSGKVKGYVKTKYLIQGEAAQQKALKVASLKAIVKTETLNVRYLPSTDAPIYDQLSEDEDYTVEKENLTVEYMKNYVKKKSSKNATKGVDLDAMYDDLSNWVMLSIDDEKVFVSKDFVSIKYKLKSAVSFKESDSSSSSDSGNGSMVSYAMQFLGNRYVWGGTSLTNGTDCSGFTMGIYRHFGISIPRTSAAQASASRSVKSSEVRPGDLFFYGSGHVSHVAMYIGGGKIIHASNARDGIKISNAYYRKPLKIGRFS